MSGRRPSPRERYRYVSENVFQDQILQLLKLNGWKVAHFRTARVGTGERARWVTPVQADGKGFPDLLAVHPPTGDVMAIELKREYDAAVTPEQAQWLAWFEVCGIDAYVWRPSNIDDAIIRCRKPRR